jgi:hypothetical protein
MDNLSGSVDFLWWRPYSEGLALGSDETFVRTGSVNTIVTDSTSEKNLNFKFDPGFRLGLGYYCPSNCWDVDLVWTHFHSKANAFGSSENTGSFDARNSDLFYNYWTRLLGLFPQEAKARWTLDMDLIDLEFGQKYYVNHCFILRPHFGLRFARIDQNYHVEAFSNSAFNNSSEISYKTFASVVKSKNDFRGVGPRIGLDIEINLGCSVFLFGKGGASLIYGTFDRGSNEAINYTSFTNPTVATAFAYDASGHNERNTVTMTDISFGLKWEHCFECCNTYHPFALAFAWEQNAFYDLNRFNFVSGSVGSKNGVQAASYQPAKTGDLKTQGLTVSAMIGF